MGNIRLPTWEQFLLNGGQAIGSSGVPLTAMQRRIATELFQGSLDITRIRTAHSGIAGIGGTAAMVWGNTILVNPSLTLEGGLLAHELTHVWQYQTTGGRYLSDATLHRSYRVPLVAGQSISAYQPEQQATIVENYYMAHNENAFTAQFAQDNPDGPAAIAELDRLIEQVRRRHPMPESIISADLHRAITGESPNMILPTPSDLSDRPQPTYQFEFRF